MSQIKPAMTAEEWAEEQAIGEVTEVLQKMRQRSGGRPSSKRQYDRGYYDALSKAIELLTSGKARRAAPRFTWEMVDHLRGVANMTRREGCEVSPMWTEAIADRIAALLPPRET